MTRLNFKRSPLLRALGTFVLGGIALLVILCLVRIFVYDSFIVSGPSMEPTFHDGQKVRAFKCGIGARIYTSYDFTDPELHAFRMPGPRKIRRGDVAVFNHPHGMGPGSWGGLFLHDRLVLLCGGQLRCLERQPPVRAGAGELHCRNSLVNLTPVS